MKKVNQSSSLIEEKVLEFGNGRPLGKEYRQKVVSVQNKFVRGFVAGAIAGVVMAALNLISFTLGIAKVRYLDIVAIVAWGNFPESTWEKIIAQVLQIAIAGLLGIAFVYFLPNLERSRLLLKGAAYGAAIWVAIHATGTFFHIPILEKSTAETNLSHLVIASIYGLVLTSVLTWLESYAESYKHDNQPTPKENEDA